MNLNYENLISKEATENFIKRILRSVFPPPQKITISEWADKYRILSANTAEPGRWKTSRAPYQKEIMDAACDPRVEEIIAMTAAQIGKTDIIGNIIEYFIDQDPSPMLMVQPTIQTARGYSKKKLAPMLKDTIVVHEKMKGFQQSVLEKTFPGGFLTIVGSNAAAGLASNSVRIVLMDELDRYAASAGTEGDQVDLAKKRTDTFGSNRKIIVVSTPGLESTSKVSPLYEISTMETWNLPCPSCKEYTTLEFENFDIETLDMQCPICGILHSEQEWKEGQTTGKWVAKHPERIKRRGFYMNGFASPWVKWEQIATEYKEAQNDPLKMMVFWNTRLGLPWKGTVEDEKKWQKLYERREEYEAELPKEALVLTAGLDTQDNRIECEVIGWGIGEESWGIEYKVFPGDPDEPEVWKMVDEYLDKKFYYKNGESLQIKMSFIDTGGHRTHSVYNYVHGKEHRGIYGIKGDSGGNKGFIIKNNIVNKTNQKPVNLILLGVNDLKDLLYKRLGKEEPGDGYCHFPSDISKGYSQKYFKGLTAEKKVEVKNAKGQIKQEWIQIRKRNEPVDLRDYGTAALKLISPDFHALAQSKKKNIKIEGRKQIKKIKLIKKGGK